LQYVIKTGKRPLLLFLWMLMNEQTGVKLQWLKWLSIQWPW